MSTDGDSYEYEYYSDSDNQSFQYDLQYGCAPPEEYLDIMPMLEEEQVNTELPPGVTQADECDCIFLSEDIRQSKKLLNDLGYGPITNNHLKQVPALLILPIKDINLMRIDSRCGRTQPHIIFIADREGCEHYPDFLTALDTFK